MLMSKFNLVGRLLAWSLAVVTSVVIAQTDKWGVTVEGGRSVLVGPNGERFMLMGRQDLGSPLVALPSHPRAPTRPMAVLPSSVDLSADQTPIRHQGGRNTCTVFSLSAAIEAAYKRKHGLSLDLSEQYFNHVMQMLRGVAPARGIQFSEVNAGSVGGGGIDINAFYMLRAGLGLPVETVLPYIGDAQYELHDDADVPNLMDYGPMHSQRAVDDFNLSDVQQDYRFPFPLRTVVLPQEALDGAKYKATAGVSVAGADLDWYRTQLAAQREVVIQFRCCDGQPGWNSTQTWNLPPGSNGGNAGHAMLLLGYLDAERVFLAKNSWGSDWANGGYVKLSYDFVGGAIEKAVAMVDIADPAEASTVWNNHQLYLGRWNLDFDGRKALLDIYGLPRVADDGTHLSRLGTLFLEDGRKFRVNGEMAGNGIDFWVDWNQPDPPIGTLAGTHFHGYLFSRDHRAMAGTVIGDAGDSYGFQAIKGPDPVTGVARSPNLNLKSYLGTWKLNHDGWRGTLKITRTDAASRRIFGTYTDDGGVVRKVSGIVGRDNRTFTFWIPFTTPRQEFNGYLNRQELGVMSGVTRWGGIEFAFFGTRE